MSSDPDFLTLEDVLLLHEEQLARPLRHGGGLRVPHRAEPAVRGRQQAHRTRASALVFLDLNGVTIADPDSRLHEAMIDLAEKRLDKGTLAALLRSLVVPAE